MKTNITVLRGLVEASRRECERHSAVFKAADAALSASSDEYWGMYERYREIVFAAFLKVYPGCEEALAALKGAHSDLGSQKDLHTLLTDADCNGNDDEEYGYDLLRSDVFDDAIMQAAASAMDSIELTFRLSEGRPEMSELAEKVALARTSLKKIRGKSRRSYDSALALCSRFEKELTAIQTAADEARLSIGHALVESKQLRRAGRSRKR